jgi:hypothetical protein
MSRFEIQKERKLSNVETAYHRDGRFRGPTRHRQREQEERVMSRLSMFFKDADTQLGVFYPNHYLLAIFPSLADADRVKETFKRAGCVDEDVISVSGEELVHFSKDHLLRHGLWGALMTQLSRMFGTEARYRDSDLAAAKRGAALVAVHCPTEKVKTDTWKLLEPAHPLVARYYHFAGIEHLAGEN